MLKKIVVFLVVLISSVIIIPNVTALAAPELKVSVSAGLDGKAKYGKGAPLLITVENSGTAFSGDIVLEMQQSYDSGLGEAIPFSVGAGETKTVSMILPRMYDFNMYGNQNAKSIYFYEGGWEKGKEISHKGTQLITAAMYYDDTKLIVSFTDNIDRLVSLKGMRLLNVSDTQVIDASKIGANKYPEVPEGWGAADYIVMDEYPIADMPIKQQEALLGWVRSGGILVIGGSDHVEAEVGVFSEYLPLTLEGKTTIDPEIMNSWSSSERFDSQIQSYTASLNTGAQPIFETEQSVVAGYRSVGNGIIMQTSFSIGDEPFSKNPGATAFWNAFLEVGNKKLQSSQSTRYYEDPLEAMRYTINSANDLFPSFKVSAPILIGVIILYMIIIIPVLYLLLKRKDKREHAWWIIPTIAIVTSVFIFAYGAKDRVGNAQLQHTAVVNVNKDGSATGYFAESILTNKSGDFTFKVPQGTTLTNTIPQSGFRGFNPSFHKKAIVEKDASDVRMHLRDVGFWNVATMNGKSMLDSLGVYEVALTVEDKQLKGTISNQFPFPLKEVSIWSGTTQILIGDLGPGETVQVDQTLKTSTLVPKRSMFNMHMGNPITNTDDLDKMRKDSLLSYTGDYIKTEPKPFIIGYTDTQVIPIELEKMKPSISALTMLMQPIEAEIILTKNFTVDSEMMAMQLKSEINQYEPHSIGDAQNSYYFDEGVYLQTWQLPDNVVNQQFNWKSLEISKIQKQLYDVSIFNVNTQAFEELASEKSIAIDNPVDFVTPEGKIIIRMEFKEARNGNEGRPPELTLNGEVVK